MRGFEAPQSPARVRRRFVTVATWGLFLQLALLSGCAVLGGSGPGSAVAGGDAEPMSQMRMELLFSQEVDAIVGSPGAIQTRVDGISVYLISDEKADRMRIIAPIAMVSQFDPRVLQVMLEANFHRTLDARYSTSEGVIYAAFLHPISSLSAELLASGLAQVLSLKKTFGTSFSSGVLDFGVPDDSQAR